MKWIKLVWETLAGKVIVGVVSSAAASVFAYLQGWWPTILEYLQFGWAFLFRKIDLPYWAFGLLLVPTGLVLFVLGAVAIDSLRKKDRQISQEDYTRDTFFNILWSWRWGSYGVYNLGANCPHCLMPIQAEDISHYNVVPRFRFACDGPNCGAELFVFEKRYGEIQDDVKRRIQQKLNTGDWRNVVLDQQQSAGVR